LQSRWHLLAAVVDVVILEVVVINGLVVLVDVDIEVLLC
jgi:hypothetical protein